MDDTLPRPGTCPADQIRATLVEFLRKADGCALCRLLLRLQIDHVTRFATAQRETLEALREFYAGRVLCNFHFWEVDRSFDSPFFTEKLFEILALLPADLGLTDPGASLVALPLRPDRCWVCREVARDEADYVAALVQQLDDAAFRAEYERSRGLCLPHVYAVATRTAPGPRAWLLNAELAHWRQLRTDLAELQRKRVPELRVQLTPSEDSAPFRCIQKLVGGRGRHWPTEAVPPAGREEDAP